MSTASSRTTSVRIAQIGCGYWDVNLLRCFQQVPDVIVAGVAELRQELVRNADRFTQKHNWQTEKQTLYRAIDLFTKESK